MILKNAVSERWCMDSRDSDQVQYPCSENKGAVTAQLICIFVFAYANCLFSGAVALLLVLHKTCFVVTRNVYPLEPHFYIVKLGYAGVYLFFLFLLQNIDCWYSLEGPRRGSSNLYPQSIF